jgi:hypothetical protein
MNTYTSLFAGCAAAGALILGRLVLYLRSKEKEAAKDTSNIIEVPTEFPQKLKIRFAIETVLMLVVFIVGLLGIALLFPMLLIHIQKAVYAKDGIFLSYKTSIGFVVTFTFTAIGLLSLLIGQIWRLFGEEIDIYYRTTLFNRQKSASVPKTEKERYLTTLDEGKPKFNYKTVYYHMQKELSMLAFFAWIFSMPFAVLLFDTYDVIRGDALYSNAFGSFSEEKYLLSSMKKFEIQPVTSVDATTSRGNTTYEIKVKTNISMIFGGGKTISYGVNELVNPSTQDAESLFTHLKQYINKDDIIYRPLTSFELALLKEKANKPSDVQTAALMLAPAIFELPHPHYSPWLVADDQYEKKEYPEMKMSVYVPKYWGFVTEEQEKENMFEEAKKELDKTENSEVSREDIDSFQSIMEDSGGGQIQFVSLRSDDAILEFTYMPVANVSYESNARSTEDLKKVCTESVEAMQKNMKDSYEQANMPEILFDESTIEYYSPRECSAAFTTTLIQNPPESYKSTIRLMSDIQNTWITAITYRMTDNEQEMQFADNAIFKTEFEAVRK